LSFSFFSARFCFEALRPSPDAQEALLVQSLVGKLLLDVTLKNIASSKTGSENIASFAAEFAPRGSINSHSVISRKSAED
jgi:hypothetical protein